jgi:N-acetyl-alpha-D-glucosaminyl L-malate synthase BshA
LGRDPAYGPAIRHALTCSDAVTAVSHFLQQETLQLLALERPIEVIYNFFAPRPPSRSREEVRRELGVGAETLIVHSSNLRPLKRIDVLLEAAARLRARVSLKRQIHPGGAIKTLAGGLQRLGLASRVVVRDNVRHIEDYLQAADLALVTSDSESFCLSILESMCFGCPSVATRVGGIPEVIEDNVTGRLLPAGDASAVGAALEELIGDAERRRALGAAAREVARRRFSGEVVVAEYEALYRRLAR